MEFSFLWQTCTFVTLVLPHSSLSNVDLFRAGFLLNVKLSERNYQTALSISNGEMRKGIKTKPANQVRRLIESVQRCRGVMQLVGIG
jgi:hypothetical protein